MLATARVMLLLPFEVLPSRQKTLLARPTGGLVMQQALLSRDKHLTSEGSHTIKLLVPWADWGTPSILTCFGSITRSSNATTHEWGIFTGSPSASVLEMFGPLNRPQASHRLPRSHGSVIREHLLDAQSYRRDLNTWVDGLTHATWRFCTRETPECTGGASLPCSLYMALWNLGCQSRDGTSQTTPMDPCYHFGWCVALCSAV